MNKLLIDAVKEGKEDYKLNAAKDFYTEDAFITFAVARFIWEVIERERPADEFDFLETIQHITK